MTRAHSIRTGSTDTPLSFGSFPNPPGSSPPEVPSKEPPPRPEHTRGRSLARLPGAPRPLSRPLRGQGPFLRAKSCGWSGRLVRQRRAPLPEYFHSIRAHRVRKRSGPKARRPGARALRGRPPAPAPLPASGRSAQGWSAHEGASRAPAQGRQGAESASKFPGPPRDGGERAAEFPAARGGGGRPGAQAALRPRPEEDGQRARRKALPRLPAGARPARRPRRARSRARDPAPGGRTHLARRPGRGALRVLRAPGGSARLRPPLGQHRRRLRAAPGGAPS